MRGPSTLRTSFYVLLVLLCGSARPRDEGNAEMTSPVTYDIEVFMEMKLTVTHEEMDQEMFESVSFGWPAVISGLKTLLETGTIAEAAGKRWENCYKFV